MNNIHNEQSNWFEYYKKHFDFEFNTQPLNIYKYLYEIIESKESGNLTYVNLGDFFYDKYIHFLNEKLDLINKSLEDLIQNKEVLEYVDFYKIKVESIIKEYLKIEPKIKVNLKNSKTKQNWFVIGVKFATGEIQKMLKEKSATEIAETLGNKKGFRPYISETSGILKTDSKNKDKNIYLRQRNDIELILEYCVEKKLEISQDFKDNIKHIITD